ncbi:hypothetical protein ACSU1N_03605 [Thermogladius sp. 4427co]|uniref:hypothetical protein n=1 Tax=Thermogladius sp. 4427co TaxID=3450718 RepID=UPI003F7A78D1
MVRISIVLLLVLVIVLSLRAYPYLYSSTFFSTDVWGIVRNSIILYSSSPIDLKSNAFDNYNNYWPVTSLQLAIFSKVTGLEIIQAVATLAGSITIAVFLIGYSFKKGVKGLFSALVLSLAFNIVFMTTGYAKEGYAYVLLLTILYFILHIDKTGLIALLAPSLALPFTHHLTSLIAFAFLYSLFMILVASHYTVLDPLKYDPPKVLVSILILAVSQSLQYYLLGRYSILAYASHWLALSLISYLTFFSLAGLLVYVYYRKLLDTSLSRIPTILAYSILLLTLLPAYYFEHNVYSLDTLTTITVLYMASALILVALGVILWSRENSLLPIVLLTSLAGLILFFINEDIPGYESIIYRVAGFSVFPTAISISFIDKTGKRMVSTIVFYSAVMLASFTLVLAGVVPGLGWYWLYHGYETYTGSYISVKTTGLVVYTDVKQSMMLSGLYNVSASNILNQPRQDCLLLVYNYMLDKGALIEAGKSVKIFFEPSNYTGIIYSNGYGVLAIC